MTMCMTVNQPFGQGAAGGIVERGNIDLNRRPVVKNSDGSISTERSMSFNDGKYEVLIPTVIDGRVVSEDEAVRHYFKTGQHLGKFKTPKEADAFAQRLHERQAKFYGEKRKP